MLCIGPLREMMVWDSLRMANALACASVNNSPDTVKAFSVAPWVFFRGAVRTRSQLAAGRGGSLRNYCPKIMDKSMCIAAAIS